MGDIGRDGESLGDYRLLRRVGSGGMGIVYEAWDQRLDRRVALKMLHPHLATAPGFPDRFLVEARSAARIEHPNVARIYRVETISERLVIEMQFIEGTPMDALLDSGPLALDQTVHVLRQVLDALGTCHARGIIHCDLKPGNLLVTSEAQVYLTDFGIARAIARADAAAGEAEALSGPRWGTPRYSPPEAWDDRPATPQWDLYSLGVLLHEALSGSSPFGGMDAALLRQEKTGAAPFPLKGLRDDVSPGFSDLVEALMASDPAGRPADVKETTRRFAATPEARLQMAVTQPLASAQPPVEHSEHLYRGPALPKELPAPEQRKNRLVWGVAICALFIAVIAGLSYLLTPGAEPLPPALLPSPVEAAPAAALPSLLNPEFLLATSYSVFFAAEDARHGRELWCLRSGEFVPTLVADIVPGPGSSNPKRLTHRGIDDFTFVATTPESGDELWFCADLGNDSSPVKMVKDIIPGPMGSDPKVIAVHENLVLFYATTLEAGCELWCSNMNEAQTAMVRDVLPGIHNAMPMAPITCSSESALYVMAFTDGARGMVLWEYSFANHGMHEVMDIDESAGPMAMAGGRLLFSNADKDHGMELWSYDPATGRAGLLLDIREGVESSNPSYMYAAGERALFRANTPEHGVELWLSDGTRAGTRMLADLNPGPESSDPYGYVAGAGGAFFRAHDEAHGDELWFTDGTPAGTVLVADVWPGSGSSVPYNLSFNGDCLFFSAKDEKLGEELFVAYREGGQWRVRLVTDLRQGAASSEPHDLVWMQPNLGAFLAWNSTETIAVYQIRAFAEDPALYDIEEWRLPEPRMPGEAEEL